MYFKGIWEEDRAMQELKYYKKNDQICVVNQDVINTYLKFVKSNDFIDKIVRFVYNIIK